MDPRYTSTPYPMVIGEDLPTGCTPGLSPVDRPAAAAPPNQYSSFGSRIAANFNDSCYSADALHPGEGGGAAGTRLADTPFRFEGKYLFNMSCTFL